MTKNDLYNTFKFLVTFGHWQFKLRACFQLSKVLLNFKCNSQKRRKQIQESAYGHDTRAL